jgi:hypothetical protein
MAATPAAGGRSRIEFRPLDAGVAARLAEPGRVEEVAKSVERSR